MGTGAEAGRGPNAARAPALPSASGGGRITARRRWGVCRSGALDSLVAPICAATLLGASVVVILEMACACERLLVNARAARAIRTRATTPPPTAPPRTATFKAGADAPPESLEVMPLLPLETVALIGTTPMLVDETPAAAAMVPTNEAYDAELVLPSVEVKAVEMTPSCAVGA